MNLETSSQAQYNTPIHDTACKPQQPLSLKLSDANIESKLYGTHNQKKPKNILLKARKGNRDTLNTRDRKPETRKPELSDSQTTPKTPKPCNVGALTIRIGFWGIVYYAKNKEPPQNSTGTYLGPHSNPRGGSSEGASSPQTDVTPLQRTFMKG